MRLKLFWAIIAVLGLFLFFGQEQALSDCSVSGVYQSDWGSVFLNEQYQNISGTWKNGTVTGNREGNIINYIWYQGSNPGGRGIWQISPDCSQLTGPWGKGNSDSDGGYWNLHK